MGTVVRKFFADRGTHLAAMIAYFALLAFVPLLFLSLAVLGLADRPNASSFFVHELSKTFPSTPVKSILKAVRAIRANATVLGIVGGAFLIWSSLGFFSVLEERVQHRLRPAEPWLPAREGARHDDDGRLARLALRVAPRSALSGRKC